MKTSKFKRVEQPKRVEPEWKMCKACNVFRAECYVPVGERSEQMCWLCAHIHVEHDVPIDKILDSEACECAPHEIDPTRPHPSVLNGTYVERPQYVGKDSIRFEHGDSRRMKHPDDWKTGHFYNQRTGHMETHVRGEVIAEFTLAGESVDYATGELSTLESAREQLSPVAAVREERPRRK